MRLPVLEPEPGEAGGEVVDALAGLGPRQADGVVVAPERDGVRARLGRAPERLGHARRLEGRRGPAVAVLLSMISPSPPCRLSPKPTVPGRNDDSV